MIVIGLDRTRINAVAPPEFQPMIRIFQCRKGSSAHTVQAMQNLRTGEDLFFLIFLNLSLLHTIFKILKVLLLHRLPALQKPDAFIQKYKRAELLHIIQQAHTFTVMLFRIQFCCRIKCQFVHIFKGTLALCIKTPDRIHLIIPQFHTNRIFFRQRIDVNDSATDGKLSRHLHLANPFIAHLHQPEFHGLCLQYTSHTDRHYIFFQHFKRQKRIHAAIQCSNNHSFLFSQKTAHRRYSLS